MTKVELEDILNVIASHILDTEIEEIMLSTDFENDLGADSLDRGEIFLEVECQFKLAKFSEEETEKIHTFGNLVNLVESKIHCTKIR